MPKVNIQKNEGTIVWDAEDFLGGLHPQFLTNSGFKRLTNTYAHARTINPYRVYGSLCPGYLPTDATNVTSIDSAAASCVAVNDTKAYLGAGNDLHELTISTNTITAAGGTFPHAITSATILDTVIYGISGTNYLFYSWYDGTDGDVGRYDFSNPPDDDYMSTVPTGGAVLGKSHPLPMVVGEDDNLYIGDGNILKKFDGATFFPTRLTLPAKFIISSFAKISPDTLVIFGYNSTTGSSYNLGGAKAYFWDYVSDDPYRAVILEDNFCQAGFNWKGTIGCFTQGRPSDKETGNKFSRIQIWDGGKFVQVVEFVGNIPTNYGVDILGDMIQWNSQGVIYSWGSPFGDKPVLNKIGEGSGTTSGILKTLSSTKQVISSGTTTSGGLQSLNSNYFATSQAAMAAAEPNFGLRKKGKLKDISIVYNKASSGGRGVTIKMRDKSGDKATIVSEDKTITALEQSFTLDTSGNPLPSFKNLYPEITYDAGSAATIAPIIDRIEAHFEIIDNNE